MSVQNNDGWGYFFGNIAPAAFKIFEFINPADAFSESARAEFVEKHINGGDAGAAQDASAGAAQGVSPDKKGFLNDLLRGYVDKQVPAAKEANKSQFESLVGKDHKLVGFVESLSSTIKTSLPKLVTGENLSKLQDFEGLQQPFIEALLFKALSNVLINGPKQKLQDCFGVGDTPEDVATKIRVHFDLPITVEKKIKEWIDPSFNSLFVKMKYEMPAEELESLFQEETMRFMHDFELGSQIEPEKLLKDALKKLLIEVKSKWGDIQKENSEAERKKKIKELAESVILFFFPGGLEGQVTSIIGCAPVSSLAAPFIKKILCDKIVAVIKDVDTKNTAALPREREFAKNTGDFVANLIKSMLATDKELLSGLYDVSFGSESDGGKTVTVGGMIGEDGKAWLTEFIPQLAKTDDFEILWNGMGAYIGPIVLQAFSGIKETLSDPKVQRDFKLDLVNHALGSAKESLEGTVASQEPDYINLIDKLLKAAKAENLPLPKELKEPFMNAIKNNAQKIYEKLLVGSLNEERIRIKILYNIAKVFNQDSYEKKDIDTLVSKVNGNFKDFGKDKKCLYTFIQGIMQNNNKEERERSRDLFLKVVGEKFENEAERASFKQKVEKVLEIAEHVRSGKKGSVTNDNGLTQEVRNCWEKRNPKGGPKVAVADPLEEYYKEKFPNKSDAEKFKKMVREHIINGTALTQDVEPHIIEQERMQVNCEELLGKLGEKMDPSILQQIISWKGTDFAPQLASILRVQLQGDLFDEILASGIECAGENMRTMEHPKDDARINQMDEEKKESQKAEERLFHEHLHQGIPGIANAAFTSFFQELGTSISKAICKVFPKVVGRVIGTFIATVLQGVISPLWWFIRDVLLRRELEIHGFRAMELAKSKETGSYLTGLVNGALNYIQV